MAAVIEETIATALASNGSSNSNGTDNVAPKIIDILNQHSVDDEPMVSLEYFPPRTEEGVKHLYSRMGRMRKVLNPAFTDVTWGAGGSTADLSLELAINAQQTGHVANLHMTCTNLTGTNDPKSAVKATLQHAYKCGIRNIVALRGDPPAGQNEWKASENGFTCALDLVHFIRKELADYDFGIAVAGYPEGHPNAISEIEDPSTLTEREQLRASTFDGKTYCCLEADYKKEMDYLKEKVDAGSDFIITQMFFDVDIFIQFVKDCREWNITCPIVPGIMCMNTVAGFNKMTQFCKTRVPPSVRERIDALQDNGAAVKQFGIDFGVEMCQKIIDARVTPVLHFYTLNLEKVVYGVLDELGWNGSDKSSGKSSVRLLDLANESDAATQTAKGSAWARVGDTIQCASGQGVVLELRDNGNAIVEMIETKEKVEVDKGDYKKVF